VFFDETLILENLGAYCECTSPASAIVEVVRDISSGGRGGYPHRKLTFPQANTTDGARACARFGDLHSPLAAGSVDTLNAGDPLPHGRTAVATDVLVKGDGDVERHSIKHEFSGVFVLVLYRGSAQYHCSMRQPLTA